MNNENGELDVLYEISYSTYLCLPSCFFQVNRIAFLLFTPAGDLAGLDTTDEAVALEDPMSVLE